MLSQIRNHFSLAHTRKRIAKRFLFGPGLEIGALSRPLKVSHQAKVKYVDRAEIPGLRKHYPELRWRLLTPVDRVDDGEILSTFSDASQNFVIANHMLEHCENPIGTIRNHLRVLRPGGVLYYAIPEKTRTFDKDRPITSLVHFLRDDNEGPQAGRLRHYLEWAELVNRAADPRGEAERLMRENYSIHFHVWDTASLFQFWSEISGKLGFSVLHFEQNHNEVISILQKQ